MNIIHGIKNSFNAKADVTFQAFGHALLFLKNYRNNIDTFQKICQLGSSVLSGLNWYKGSNYLPKLSAALFSTCDMHFFTGALKLPYMWAYPIYAEGINEFTLVKVVSEAINRAAKGSAIVLEPGQAKLEAKKYVEEYLEKMRNKDIRYKNFKAFKEDFQVKFKEKYALFDLHCDESEQIVKNVYTRRLGELLKAKVKKTDGSSLSNETANNAAQDYLRTQLAGKVYYSFEKFKKDLQETIQKDHANVSLAELEEKKSPRLKVLKSSDFLSKISTFFFEITDVLCVPLYLQIWKLNPVPAVWGFVERAGYGSTAKALGQFKVFQWVYEKGLGDIVWMTVSAGYAVQLTNSIRQLHDESLTPAQRYNTKWSVIESLFELVYCQVSLHLNQEKHQPIVIACTIIAKTIGLLKIAFMKPIKLFDRAVSAA